MTVDGKIYGYLCTVEDEYQDGRKTSTTLRFPDQTLKLIWNPGKQVELHFEGMVPKSAPYATAEGETNFVFEKKTYYYHSDKERARLEVEHFQEGRAADVGGGAPAGASGKSAAEPTTATERVRFDAGTTGTELTGALTPGSSVRYVLGAKKPQDLYVQVAAKGPDIYYQIFNPDGTFLLDQMTSAKEYRGQLWQSGDHVIKLRADGRLQTEGLENHRLTYHDPCQIARRGGVLEQPHALLGMVSPDYPQMRDHGRMNWC